MEVASTTTAMSLSAINETLMQISMTLGRMAARQDQMLVDSKKMTAALVATSPMFVTGQVLEQQTTKPSSSSLFSPVQVMGAGALYADSFVASATPTRCSTVGSAASVGSNHVAVASPTSGRAYLPATTSTNARNSTLQGVVKSGTNMPAGSSTHVLTGEPARDVNADTSLAPPCQVVRHPEVHHPLLPQVSFPCFHGDNPRLWRHKCLEYFKLFNINECMWVTAATLHMEGAAAHWYKAYKLSRPVGDWSQFINAVEENFNHRDSSQMVGSHVELYSPSSSLMVDVPSWQHITVDVFPPETLVFLEDKTNMDGDVCQTYHESQDNFKTHDISQQKLKWCETSLRDPNQMPEPDVAGYEEVLTHAGGVSLFLEHLVQPANKVVFSELHSMEPEGEVIPPGRGLSLFLEEGLYSTNEVCDVVLLEDAYGSDKVLTHVGGLSIFLEFDLDMSVVSADEVLQDYLPWKCHALYLWSNTGEGSHFQIANMPQHVICSGCNDTPSSYLVMDKWTPWSRSGFSPGFHDRALNTRLTNIIGMTRNKFSSWDSPEVLANATEILCVVTQCAPPSIAANISRPSYIGRLFCWVLEGTGHNSVMVHSLSACLYLLCPKILALTSYQPYRNNVSHGALVTAHPKTVDGMIASLGNLLDLLKTSAAANVLPMVYGCLHPPLGKHQLKIVEVIFALLTASSETSDNELLKHSMDLFFEDALV
jgi:hypothetical protein